MRLIKNKKIKRQQTQILWPKEKVLNKIRKRLSSPTIQGSRVIGSDAPLVDRIKQDLCSQIVKFYMENNLTQKDLGMKLDIDAPEINRILHYQIDRYSKPVGL